MGQTWVKHPGSSWWVAGSWTFLDLIVRLEEWLVCLTFNTLFLPSLYFVTHRKQYLSINLGFIPWIIRCRHTCGNKILRSFFQMGLYIALILHFWSILYCSLYPATDYFERSDYFTYISICWINNDQYHALCQHIYLFSCK